MAYPSSFNMDTFKSLNSFNKRIKYCELHLTRISSGSARIVYQIDDKKVLKLAKNRKGLAQNEVECTYSSDGMLTDIIAHVFDYDEDNFLWLEMEKANKLTKPLFKQITGYNFDDFKDAVLLYGLQSGNGGYNTGIDKDLFEKMWENEFIYDIFQFIGNYGIPVGDLSRTSTYGIISRNDSLNVVIIDYGLNSDVIADYYS